MKAVVGPRGRVTIPKLLRDRLGLRAGTILALDAVNGRLVGTKVTATEIDDLYGSLDLGMTTDAMMSELRGSGPNAS